MVSHRAMLISLLTTLLVFGAELAPVIAMEAPAVQRGRHFAQTYCARCHAVGRFGPSDMAEAPPFRTLGQKYPLEDLAEPLAEGIRTGHPAMPEWHLDPGDASDLIAYMKTIQIP